MLFRQRMSRVLTLTARASHWTEWRQWGTGGISKTTIQCDQQFAGARVVPVFAQPHALPCAQI